MTTPADTSVTSERPLVVALVLFAIAWLARALFAASMPDEAWPHSIVFKGDIFEWFTAVASQRMGTPELAGLPLRPPGMVWLVDLFWPDVRSADVSLLQHVWRVLGSLVAPLVYLAARRDLAESTARASGVLAAFVTGPLLLTGALESETPYLALATAAFAVPANGFGGAFVRGVLHGAACLLRVEHLLVVVLLGLWHLARRSTRRAVLTGGLVVGFAAVLVPWHLHAWETTRAIMASDAPRNAMAEAALQGVEGRSAHVAWSDEAARERDAWPAFVRRTAAAFVADTVRHRGDERVELDDLSILDDAFGARPVPLPEHFFVSLYGPLNFALSADVRNFHVGFERRALNDPPPLVGGPARYPPDLIAQLPPTRLSLDYLPHLALLAGHDVDPADAARLALSERGLARITHAWRGTASGFGGAAFPVGLSGTRGRVDLLVSDGHVASAVAILIALLVVVGLWHGGASAMPWMLFVVAKLGTAAVMFGYARLGATAGPAVVVLVALALQRLWTERRAALLAVALLGLELARATVGVDVTFDGQPVGAEDLAPLSDYEPHVIDIEISSPH